MIIVRRGDGDAEFVDATRVSTDEHNNLEIWGGVGGEDLIYLCAQSCWIDTIISPEEGGI